MAIGQTDNIIIYGDSLSAGYGIEINQSWPALLQDKLKANKYSHQVINSSISGETTEGGVARIERILDRYTPEIMVIELGGNDGLRGFPVHLIKNNLEKMLVREKRMDLYKRCINFLDTRIELDQNGFKFDVFEH